MNDDAIKKVRSMLLKKRIITSTTFSEGSVIIAIDEATTEE